MTKSLCLCGCVLLAAAGLAAQEATNSVPSGPARAASSELGPEAQPIQQALQSYVGAFNKRDANAVAALWMPQGVYVDRSTGERIEGREALEKDFAATFKEKPTAQLTGTVQHVRLITPDVAAADG